MRESQAPKPAWSPYVQPQYTSGLTRGGRGSPDQHNFCHKKQVCRPATRIACMRSNQGALSLAACLDARCYELCNMAHMHLHSFPAPSAQPVINTAARRQGAGCQASLAPATLLSFKAP